MPTAVKRSRGSKVRHDVELEPTAPPGLPPRPAYLAADDAAASAWSAIATRLLDQRVLTTAHGELLAVLADAWAQYVRLQAAYAEMGYRSVLIQKWTEQGRKRERVVENPLCRQLRLQALLLNTLFGEFGQTPASAPKVHARADQVDPLESFLSGGPARVVPFPKSKGART